MLKFPNQNLYLHKKDSWIVQDITLWCGSNFWLGDFSNRQFLLNDNPPNDLKVCFLNHYEDEQIEKYFPLACEKLGTDKRYNKICTILYDTSYQGKSNTTLTTTHICTTINEKEYHLELNTLPKSFKYLFVWLYLCDSFDVIVLYCFNKILHPNLTNAILQKPPRIGKARTLFHLWTAEDELFMKDIEIDCKV